MNAVLERTRKIVSVFVREQKRYDQGELRDILTSDKDNDDVRNKEIVAILRKLKEYGIVKAVAKSEEQKDLSYLADEDVLNSAVETGDSAKYYVFTFVGVIMVLGKVIKCYPKYLLGEYEPSKLKDPFKKVIRVLDAWGKNKDQDIKLFSDLSDKKNANLFSLLLFMLHDYYENGLYTNTEEIVESNGTGEILWDKTINETFTLISNKRPYYVDLQTRKRVTDEYDYFTRLHMCILTQVSKELEEADLLDVFDIVGVDLTDDAPDDFGDEEYILYRIERELNVQYNTRKQLVLKTMHAYISGNRHLSDMSGVTLFGTNSFNLLWEGICSEILDNMRDKVVTSTPRRMSLLDMIEKPTWTATKMTSADTLIPDIVTMKGGNFYIFDAKYYNAHLVDGEEPRGVPGIESVVKQYMYRMAYNDFIKDNGFNKVYNCFLMPTDSADVLNKGSVYMNMLNKLGLENIKVRFLPAEMAYDLYLSNEKLDISKLKLDEEP